MRLAGAGRSAHYYPGGYTRRTAPLLHQSAQLTGETMWVWHGPNQLALSAHRTLRVRARTSDTYTLVEDDRIYMPQNPDHGVTL